MSNNFVEARYVVVFEKDGLQLDPVLEDLRNYGEITEVSDDELIASDGGRTPVTLVCITGSIGDLIKIKIDYNCVTAEDCKYVLFPMATLEEKKKVEKWRAIGA